MVDSTPIRRVVTGHDPSARAVIHSDESFTPELITSSDARFALLWTTDTVPADNKDEIDGRDREAGLTIDRGSVLRVVDLLPGCASPMHRTDSIDYGIVIAGQVELELDDGVTTLLGPGDVIVQRGTIHLWRNPSATALCRIVFVLIEARPFEHAGAPLPPVHV